MLHGVLKFHDGEVTKGSVLRERDLLASKLSDLFLGLHSGVQTYEAGKIKCIVESLLDLFFCNH
jgi:hypothetical protein